VNDRLRDKAILVTGAAGAIGRATAERLSAEGARLVLADRPGTPLEEVCTALGPRHSAAFYDAATSGSGETLVQGAVDALGRLDGVCNIAGFYGKARSTDVTDSDWNLCLQVNLTSAFTIARSAIPHLARTRGCVVSTSSLAALEGLAYSTAYAVAKAGIIAMTKSLAAEYASAGIRFNAVCPGGIRSSMSAAKPVPDADPDLTFRRSKLLGFEGGLGEPRDAAAAFAYLLSEDARFVSGSVLVVDGAQFQI
jgi:NAD(P)-dependent dehydrogenase (short-subunit alcohol dehydrogenase family)